MSGGGKLGAGTRKAVRTAGGTVVLVEPSHALPLVDLVVALRSGAVHDPAQKEGLARITTRSVRTGTRRMKAEQIELELDTLGADLGAQVSASSISFHLQVIRRNLEPAVALLGEILSRPAFRASELERVRREMLADLTEVRENDQVLAFRGFRRVLFHGHAYGRPLGGFARTLQAIRRPDVVGFHAKHWVAGNAVIGFAGDISPDDALAVTERHLGSLPAGPAVGEPDVEPVPTRGRRIVVVDKPGRTQTQILIGSLGTHPRDRDHFALSLANTVFGGTFTSRLTSEVRSKRGWSYGASSRLGRDRHRDAWWMWTFPAAREAVPCIALQLGMLERLVERGIGTRELAFAKSYVVKGHAFEVDTAEKRLDKRIDAEVYGLPAGYHERWIEHLSSVTLDQANAALRRRLSPRDLVIVVVATAADLRAELDELPGIDRIDVVPYDRDEAFGSL